MYCCFHRHPLYGYIGDQVIDYFSHFLVNNLTREWGGTFIVLNDVLSSISRGEIIFYLTHTGPWEQGWPVIEPLYNFHPEWTLQRFSRNFTSLGEYPSLLETSGERQYVGRCYVP